MVSFKDKTVGILGGMGPAATANFLKLLVKSFNDIGVSTDSDFPRMVMLSLPLEDWGTIGAKDKASVKKQVNEGLVWLSRQDVDVVAIPCNTVHEFIVRGDTKIVNIIDATLAECPEAPIGVICSRQTRDSHLYGNAVTYLGDQHEVDTIIGNAMSGKFEDISQLLSNCKEDGIKTVVLGCTELSLCFVTDDYYFTPVVIDSSAALARAVVKRVTLL